MTKLPLYRDELVDGRRRLRAAADGAFGEWRDGRAEELEREAIAPLLAAAGRFESELAAAHEALASAERMAR